MAESKTISETAQARAVTTERELDVREGEYSKLAKHMIRLNLALAVFLACLAIVETVGVWRRVIHASDRIVDAKVIMAFIAAVTVQVGTIAITGSKWFFGR